MKWLGIDVPVETQIITQDQIQMSGAMDIGDLIGKYVTGHYNKYSGLLSPIGMRGVRGKGREKMHLYWRVQNDLDCLGEVIHFHDPGLTRSLRLWMRKNMAGLAMAMGLHPHERIAVSRN